jgi:hypothetical protein
VFGRVLGSMDAVDALEGARTDPSDSPLEPQRIERVELGET